MVTATDQGGVSSIAFKASGVITKNETRQVPPAQKSVVTSFTVTVPLTAQPGQQLLLDVVHEGFLDAAPILAGRHHYRFTGLNDDP